ncbi:MAG: hypothetical protein M5R41_07200 [Bacteroidia bacterium]|nr:hypothetical protein [Bacteroidia bacterium]
MIHRAYLRITGQSGAGKTKLMEATLEALRTEMVLCVYAQSDKKLKEPKESSPRNDPHLKRYLDAGAMHAVRYHFAGAARDGIDTLYESEVMTHYSGAVLIEGDSPLSCYDLTTYVARPLPGNDPLIVAGLRDNRAEHERQLAEAEALANDPRRIIDILGADFSGRLNSFIGRNSGFFDSVREELQNKVRELRALPVPEPTPCWTLAASHNGIQDAGLIVVNIHDEAERERAEALVRDVHRLRTDKQVFDDILGWQYHRTPVTAVVANLADPNDTGRKKALARIKRAVKQGKEA